MEMVLDYSLVMENVKRIRELSDEVLSLNSKMIGISEEVRESWQGQAGETYTIACQDAAEYFKKLGIKISKLADAVQKAADELKAADEARAEAAESL